ncbi:FAD/NAD(P)-binding protein [Bacillus sp. AF23]|uniref:FAD/NAD(P)-binding protein n=1 Tax=Bacillus sp. AF23 TaxID=2821151 RepID=UPI001E38969B|nr:FAD/NAD(P)-binding protein [Bacillus sp. AF23]MCC8353409.1 FAD/NAD(P)-binding protein [Bacillus sp. AF23]
MYKWLIIGGGIQGLTLAVHLVKSGKVPIQDLAVIDPHSPLTAGSEIRPAFG